MMRFIYYYDRAFKFDPVAMENKLRDTGWLRDDDKIVFIPNNYRDELINISDIRIGE